MLIPFNQLLDSARLWIFPLERELSEVEAQLMRSEVEGFLRQWTAHNEALLAGCELRYGRFLMVATDEAQAKASGCSIDELYRRVRMLGETFGVQFASNLNVQYRNRTGEIVSASRGDFAKLAKPDTAVFDNGIATLQALRAGKWELTAKESWHAALIASGQ